MDKKQQRAKRFLEERYGRGSVSLRISGSWSRHWHCDIVVDATNEEVKLSSWDWKKDLEKRFAKIGIELPAFESEMGNTLTAFSVTWWTPEMLREGIANLRAALTWRGERPSADLIRAIARDERWLCLLEARREAAQ